MAKYATNSENKLLPLLLVIVLVLSAAIGTGKLLKEKIQAKLNLSSLNTNQTIELVSNNCTQEACLIRINNDILGTATLRGYYKKVRVEKAVDEFYPEGFSCDSGERLVVSKMLSPNASELIKYLSPTSETSTEDSVEFTIATPKDLSPQEKSSLLSSTEEKPAEVYVQVLQNTKSFGGGPCKGFYKFDILSIKSS